MAAIILPRKHYTQPPGRAGVDWANPATHGLQWLSGMPAQGSAFGVGGEGGVFGTYLRNVVDNRDALIQDQNNGFIATPTRHGVGGLNSASTAAASLLYLSSVGLLHGATQMTLLSWFVFGASDESAQWLNFRVTNQHTLDVFSKTSSSLTFGADWAGAWNGASQKTIGGLADGQFVCIGVTIRQNGAVMFANGQSFGTKSGSAFTISSAATQAEIVAGARSVFLGNAAFTYAHSDEAMLSLTANPWQLFKAEPHRIYSLPPVITIPTLSSPGVIDIATTSARPQVTLTY